MMARMLVAGSGGGALAIVAIWLAAWSLPATAVRHWVGLATAVVVGGLALRLLWRAFWLFGDVVFGQRAPGGHLVTWLPSHGSHGGNTGQTPPYVPYNPDWDPKRRIK